MSMEFKVITPDEVAVTATVEYVYLPGSLGEMGYEINYAAFDDIESYRSILNVKENEV